MCGSFFLGKTRVGGRERRFQRAQSLALHFVLGHRLRKLALTIVESLALRQLRGLQGGDAGITLRNRRGQCNDGVIQECGVALDLADLLVTPRERAAEIAHLFVERCDACIARAQLRLQFTHFLRAAAEFALQTLQARFAVTDRMIESGEQRIEHRAAALE